jgi:hypothetical protein
MIPLLTPHSQRQNLLLQQTLPHLTSHFQIREIQDSPTTPGDLVFPSLGIACLIVLDIENLDDLIIRAASVLQRRRCVIFVSQQNISEVQLKYFVHMIALTVG